MATEYLQNYDHKHFPALMAAQEIDASKGVTYDEGEKLGPNTLHRTILIGLGGTGVKTLDYVKGVLSERLTPNWSKYVGFLAIDTDQSEFELTRYLSYDEFLNITRPDINARKGLPEYYPSAWRPFCKPDVVKTIQDMNNNGAGRKRLIGRMKVHDKDSSGASDEQIVRKLEALRDPRALQPLTSQDKGNYEIYVIGSVSGGTCSGSFLEMPALVRKAFPNISNLHIYAMLYLPDTLTSLDPENANQLKANGYASLKELNYYQGITMRPGYTEQWGYNDPAALTLKLDSTKMFYDIPYLIGTSSGASATGASNARQNIAEYMISILTKAQSSSGDAFLTDQFLSNAVMKRSERKTMNGVAELEDAQESHEYPKHYGAIGFAQIAAPKKIVRAYVVGEACKVAGLRPVSAQERAVMLANHAAVLPFRGEDDLDNATDGTQRARELLQPLLEKLGIVFSAQFSLVNVLRWNDVDMWKQANTRQHQGPVQDRYIKGAVEQATNSQAMEALDAQIREAYAAFEKNVKAYVQREGPLAFYSLYNGSFAKVNDQYGTGVDAMLRNLCEMKNEFGVPCSWLDPVTAAQNEQAALAALDDANGLLDRISKRASTAAAWVTAYDNWKKAEIVKARIDHVFGENGTLRKLFWEPAALLAEQLKAFGYVVDTLADIYRMHGQCMEDYKEFSKAHDDVAEQNIAAISISSYKWLRGRAEQQVKTVNAVRLRTKVVDDFFDNRTAWLEVPEGSVVIKDNAPQLLKPNVALPAREHFDSIMGEELPTKQVTIEETFTELKENSGVSYTEFAESVIRELASHSEIMLNAEGLELGLFNRYMMYPDTLKNSTEGRLIVAALTSATQSTFGGSVGVYESADAVSIKMYQVALPFEIYHVKELKEWEGYYDVDRTPELLHGMSPDVEVKEGNGKIPVYTELTPWKDYPSILRFERDPKIPDPATGVVSEEGKVRQKLAALIKHAKELGVLYSKKDINGKWKIYRLHCDKSREWTLDVALMEPNALGLLPTGCALAESVASQNNKTMEELSCAVELGEQSNGVFGMAFADEESAWKYVERALRVHMPMQIQIRNTVAKFEQWYKVIEDYNSTVIERLKPAKLVYIMRSQLLKNTDGKWEVKQANGTQRIVARLDESGIRMTSMTRPAAANIIKAGFKAYHIYEAVCNMTDIDELYQRSRDVLNDMIMNAEDDAIIAGIEMAAFIDEERELLVQMGAILEDCETREPRTKLIEAMRAKGITNNETIKDIQRFYYRASMWEML